MNRDYEILKRQLNYIIQNSNLNVGGAFFVVKDVFRDLENLYYSQVNKELAEKQSVTDQESAEPNENNTAES